MASVSADPPVSPDHFQSRPCCPRSAGERKEFCSDLYRCRSRPIYLYMAGNTGCPDLPGSADRRKSTGGILERNRNGIERHPDTDVQDSAYDRIRSGNSKSHGIQRDDQ